MTALLAGAIIALLVSVGFFLVYKNRLDIAGIAFVVTLVVYMLAFMMRPYLKDTPPAGTFIARLLTVTDRIIDSLAKTVRSALDTLRRFLENKDLLWSTDNNKRRETSRSSVAWAVVGRSVRLSLPCGVIGGFLGAMSVVQFGAGGASGCIGYVSEPGVVVVAGVGVLLMAVVPEYVTAANRLEYRRKLPYLRNALYATVGAALAGTLVAVTASQVYHMVSGEWLWECKGKLLWFTAPASGSLIFAIVGFALATPTLVSNDSFVKLLQDAELSKIRYPDSVLGATLFVAHALLLVLTIAQSDRLTQIGLEIYKNDQNEGKLLPYFLVLAILASWAVFETTVIRLWSSRRAIYFGQGFRAQGWFAYAISWVVSQFYIYISALAIVLSLAYLLRLPWTIFQKYALQEVSPGSVVIAWILGLGACVLIVSFFMAANKAERESAEFQQRAREVSDERVKKALDDLFHSAVPTLEAASTSRRGTGLSALRRRVAELLCPVFNGLFARAAGLPPPKSTDVDPGLGLLGIALGSNHAIHTTKPIVLGAPGSAYLICSDMHRGAKNLADDFRNTSWVYLHLLRVLAGDEQVAKDSKQLPRNTTLLLNGDVDELWEEDYADIEAAYPEIIKLEKALGRAGRYLRTFGNHDVDYRYFGSHAFAQLKRTFDNGEALVLANGVMPELICIPVRDGQKPIGKLLVTHGHQGEVESDRYEIAARSIVRILWAGVQNITGVSRNVYPPEVALGTKTDRAIATWAMEKNCSLRSMKRAGEDSVPIAIIAGHTHWPYAWKPGHEKAPEHGQYRYATAPYYFNTGCAAFVNGCITGILVDSNQIRLVQISKESEKEQLQMTILSERALQEVFEKIAEAATRCHTEGPRQELGSDPL